MILYFRYPHNGRERLVGERRLERANLVVDLAVLQDISSAIGEARGSRTDLGESGQEV